MSSHQLGNPASNPFASLTATTQRLSLAPARASNSPLSLDEAVHLSSRRLPQDKVHLSLQDSAVVTSSSHQKVGAFAAEAVSDLGTLSYSRSNASHIELSYDIVGGADIGEVEPYEDKQIPFQINITLKRQDIIAFDIKQEHNPAIQENKYVINRMQRVVAAAVSEKPQAYRGHEDNRANFSVKGEVINISSEYNGGYSSSTAQQAVKLVCKTEDDRNKLWDYLGLENAPSKASKGNGVNGATSRDIIFHMAQDPTKKDNIVQTVTK